MAVLTTLYMTVKYQPFNDLSLWVRWTYSHNKSKPDAGQSPTLARPAAPLAACVQRISFVDKTTKIHILYICMNITNKNWLPRQCFSRDQKTNFKFIIYSHSSSNPENLAKIGWVDFEIIGQESL